MARAKKKLLIIEDESSIMRALSGRFSGLFEVSEARDGEAGLKKALKEHPDLIFLDIIMPKMDGITMLGKLRQDKWGQTAKVLMLTNLTHVDQEATLGLDGHMMGLLVKTDWSLEDLLKKVQCILS